MAFPPQLAEWRTPPIIRRRYKQEQLFQSPLADPVIRAVRRQKLLVLLISILAVGTGAGIGAVRQPTYTAAATLQVGTVNPNSPGFYGFVQSAADLATAFSRSITAAPVLATIHHTLGLTPTQAAQRLSAAPIPVSPSFRIIATGPTEHAAVGLAHVASKAVITYEAHANSTNPQATALLKSYQQAAAAREKAAVLVKKLSKIPATSLTEAETEALTRARAALDAAQVHATALGAEYQNAVVSSAPSTGLVSLLAGAAGATSDHRAKIELFGFLGLLAGVILGCAIAVPVDRRARARRGYS